MSTTFDNVHYFASFTKTLLIEYENQLSRATTNEQIDMIEERINHILAEVQHLQLLSFQLNCQSVQLIGKLQIKYNNIELQLMDSSWILSLYRTISDYSIKNKQMILSNNNYRFLISRHDAIQLDKISLSNLHLTSFDNTWIDECVLTFNVSNLDTFLHAFTSYWNHFPQNKTIRLLLPLFKLSLVMDTTDERFDYFRKRFQLDEMRIFPDFCPKSDEKILLFRGKRRDHLQDCIEEIFYNIEEKNEQISSKQKIRLYNPASLSINDIVRRDLNYGGFISNQNRNRSHETDDEESSDEDLWNENDEWWTCQSNRDNRTEIIQREMSVTNIQAGVIIGLNALRIDRIKQKTGAYIYINGDMKDLKRTVFMKGTYEQTDRAYVCIENLLERHKNGELSLKSPYFPDKYKSK
ncbi:hypothetical protein I4U23_014419 [Adineta vaga]|nr:hypothetical protein I4U23_014419 [Adineta vaga]